MSAKVNQDLLEERKKCEFNVEELTNYLDGSVQATEDRRKLETKVLSTKGLIDEVPEEYLSHKEKYENAVRKAVILYRALKDAEDPNQTEQEKANATYRSLLSSAVFKDNSPFTLHVAMFIPAILGHADEEQKKYWIKRASKMEIIGTYAQTELGHGTFIRGLETTATYDPKTEEFVLHSPTLTAYKWWPGSLAHTANYCVVMAHLYSQGKSCGIQPFLIQLRDEDTHMPLPGIKLGEIGAKLGFNTVNNGFLGFEHHRIKRDRMLMKNAQVLKDGTFRRSPNSKLTYGTMVYVRVIIVNAMANQLARAVTIAVRYSAVRRQSELKPAAGEPQILDYVTQQHKLFSAIASSHAFSMTAKWLTRMYQKVTADLEKGNMDELPELHAIACCLKAVTSWDTSAMTERCRTSCGGHGYMLSSNFPQIYGLVTAAVTYEGENTVLMLQTARSLVKAWEQTLAGRPLSPIMSYLSEKTSNKQEWDNSVDGIIKGFQRVATGKVASAVGSIKKYTKRGLAPEDAWNMTSVQLVAASECRHACGGHGYMMSSGIPNLYNFVSATRTYEGDYTVLLLQTARFLVKAYEQAEAKQPLTPTVSYLTLAFSASKAKWDNSPDGLIRAFQALAAGKLSACVRNMRKRMRAGLSQVDAWEVSTIQLVAAAEAHCRAVIADTYRQEIMRLTANSSPNVKLVMDQLSTLYLYYWALERTGDLLMYTSISEQDLVELQLKYEEQLLKIRPNAVGLVDAFDLRDELLHSALGSFDGRVYERLMEEALNSPMNKEPVNETYRKYLRPMMKAQL